jgi:hypothetical protein
VFLKNFFIISFLLLDSSPLFCSTNQHREIQLATYCLPYVRPPKTPNHYTHLGSVSLQSSSLSAAAAEATTLLTIVVAVSGKRQRRLLQSVRKGSAAEGMASPRACQRPYHSQLRFLPNRRNWAVAGTTSEGAASSRLRVRPTLHPLHPTQEDGQSGRKPQRAVSVSSLVVKCRWWNPNQPDPNRLTLHLPPTESVTTPGHRRFPGEPSQQVLRRVDMPSSLHGLLPPDSGSSPASCPQNHHPVHS